MAKADATKKEDRTEMLGGREVTVPGDGGPHMWKDTGEVISADERKLLTELGGEASFDFRGEQRQNPDIVFWAGEIQLKEGERPVLNPIRGVVLDIFQRPNSFKGAEEEKEGAADDATDNGKPRFAAWFMLTHSCLVKTLGKAVRKAPIGTKVWVDLNQATLGLAKIAAPKKDKEGNVVGLVEAAIDPKTKEAFQTTVNGKPATHFAWRMDLFGGWLSPTFRKYNSAKEIAEKLGGLITPPSAFMTEEDVAHLIGVSLTAPAAAPALPPPT